MDNLKTLTPDLWLPQLVFETVGPVSEIFIEVMQGVVCTWGSVDPVCRGGPQTRGQCFRITHWQLCLEVHQSNNIDDKWLTVDFPAVINSKLKLHSEIRAFIYLLPSEAYNLEAYKSVPMLGFIRVLD